MEQCFYTIAAPHQTHCKKRTIWGISYHLIQYNIWSYFCQYHILGYIKTYFLLAISIKRK